MRRLIFTGFALSLCLLLGGCWSASEIQSVSYAKAIGLDYKNGMFHVYLQTLDFSSVAKTDTSGKNAEEPGVWIGHGQGKTLDVAVNQVFRSAQLHLAFGHVSAVILSESLLNSGKISKVLDMVNRFPETRYTAWVYGTRMPIDKLLEVTSIYNLSPLDSILHNPMPAFYQNSLFPPIQGMTFIANQKEKSATTYLPSLNYTDKDWKQNDKPHDLLYIEGAFFNRDGDVHGFLPRNKLFGFSLMQPEMRRSPMVIQKDGEIFGTISIGLPKIKVKPVIRGEEVRYRIKAHYYGSLYDYLNPIDYDEMAKLAAEEIKAYITGTYKESLKQGIDVYELERQLYRKNPALWRKLSQNGEVTFLNENSIESLDVKVRIVYNGKYKRKPAN